MKTQECELCKKTFMFPQRIASYIQVEPESLYFGSKYKHFGFVKTAYRWPMKDTEKNYQKNMDQVIRDLESLRYGVAEDENSHLRTTVICLFNLVITFVRLVSEEIKEIRAINSDEPVARSAAPSETSRSKLA